MIKECIICGNEYLPGELDYVGTTCSAECKRISRNKWRKNWRASKPKEPNARDCVVCGEMIVGKHGKVKYCSAKCRRTAASQRAKERLTVEKRKAENERLRKYRQSPEGKASVQKYRQSEAYKDSQRRYWRNYMAAKSMAALRNAVIEMEAKVKEVDE